MGKKTNTVAIFYGITPKKLSDLLEELNCFGDFDCNEDSAAFQLSHTSYAFDTEKKFIKEYLRQKTIKKPKKK